MATLLVELKVRDYDMWRGAFEQDAGGRQQAGVRRYRILRPVSDDHGVMLEVDFDDVDQAEAFLHTMRTKVWPDPKKAPAKLGAPRTNILELVESHEY